MKTRSKLLKGTRELLPSARKRPRLENVENLAEFKRKSKPLERNSSISEDGANHSKET